MKKIIASFLSISLILTSCSDADMEDKKNLDNKKVAKKSFTKIISPKYNSNFKLSDSIYFDVNGTQNNVVDSFIVTYKNHIVFNSNLEQPLTFKRVGVKNLEVISYVNDTVEVQKSKVTILANQEPKILSFKLLKKYPKNPANFTQGLEFYKGDLYESTGRKGDSRLEKINLPHGTSTQSVSLASNFFGEGITFFQDKIYQLTWKANLCFIRDAKTFNEQASLSYPTEGWGVTHNDSSLIMSDGSHQLYFMNPEGFQEIDKLEVYNSKSRLPMLNELELVDNYIWANIYQYNYLAKINIHTGVVEAMLNLEPLYQQLQSTSTIDVLNGIAYHPGKKTFFVTGKLWPYYFEIDIKNQ